MTLEVLDGGQRQTPPVRRALLVQYRVMAFTTATLLIVLVFVGVPLQLAARRPEVVNDVGTMHGFLYIVYLYVAFRLTRKLRIPKWQMALVLLAGTVPFCAFIAERKMTRRFEASGASSASRSYTQRSPTQPKTPARTRRWLSPRALLLHLELALVAPGCVLAGWWQATRALAGNELSWVYSVEWPIFALIAIYGWWYLIHEDPEAYRARKQSTQPTAARKTSASGSPREVTVEGSTAKMATALAALVGLELVLGIMALIVVPLGRPSGWSPSRGTVIYLAHSILGLLLACGSVTLLARVWRSTRLARLSGWIGALGVAISGAGGLLTALHALRIGAMVVMFLGTLIAVFGYLIPSLERSS
ncbi:MAG: DUF3817 domain-containing protein [Acidimicrobiales bacterium]|jgi:integral membrane protein